MNSEIEIAAGTAWRNRPTTATRKMPAAIPARVIALRHVGGLS